MPVIPLLVLNDLYEVTHLARATQSSAQVVNRYHLRITDEGITSDTAVTLLVYVDNLWITDVVPELSNTYEYERTIVRGPVNGIAAVGAPPYTSARWTYLYSFDSDVNAGELGGQAGTAMPQNITVSYRMQTPYLGRYWRGGMHLGPIAQNQIDAANQNRIGAVALGSLNGAMLWTRTEQQLAGLGAKFRVVIASPLYGARNPGSVPPWSAASADVNSGEFNPYVRTQNSRLAPHVP